MDYLVPSTQLLHVFFIEKEIWVNKKDLANPKACEFQGLKHEFLNGLQMIYMSQPRIIIISIISLSPT